MILFSAVFRTLFMYFIVMLALRIMGKRQVGDLQPSELVVTLLLSEIATIPVQDSAQPLTGGIVAIFSLAVIEILLSVFSIKSFRFAKLIGGKSAFIIKNGTIDQKVLQDVRITVIDLLEQLRKQQIFNIEQVDWAILETDGSLSVKLKADYQNLTPDSLTQYLAAAQQNEGLPLPVISDGHIVLESLNALGFTKQNITDMLIAENKAVDDIFLMTCDRYGNNKIVLKGGKV